MVITKIALKSKYFPGPVKMRDIIFIKKAWYDLEYSLFKKVIVEALCPNILTTAIKKSYSSRKQDLK